MLSEDSRVKEADNAFDFILSTQVLEHVSSPAIYLAECFRLLKPGGKLYITTHGTYPDHACPYDFYRWTTDGLTRDLVAAGFAVSRTEKLTTGPRAALFHCDCQIHNLRTDRRTLVAHGMSAFRWAYVRLRPWLHKTCDDYFPNNRIVTHDLEHHSSLHRGSMSGSETRVEKSPQGMRAIRCDIDSKIHGVICQFFAIRTT